jgi:hypothetical protein
VLLLCAHFLISVVVFLPSDTVLVASFGSLVAAVSGLGVVGAALLVLVIADVTILTAATLELGVDATTVALSVDSVSIAVVVSRAREVLFAPDSIVLDHLVDTASASGWAMRVFGADTFAEVVDNGGVLHSIDHAADLILRVVDDIIQDIVQSALSLAAALSLQSAHSEVVVLVGLAAYSSVCARVIIIARATIIDINCSEFALDSSVSGKVAVLRCPSTALLGAGVVLLVLFLTVVVFISTAILVFFNDSAILGALESFGQALTLAHSPVA